MDRFVLYKEYMKNAGFEIYPFKTSWYNSKVSSHFNLDYKEDTLAFLVLNGPSMFENVFLPYIKNLDVSAISNDPLDECMKKFACEFLKKFKIQNAEIIHDFEMTPMRRPKILMQTAGHVSGAVRFYHKKDIQGIDPWKEDKKILGLCLHPNYGGWFAFRFVIITKDVVQPDLSPIIPE